MPVLDRFSIQGEYRLSVQILESHVEPSEVGMPPELESGWRWWKTPVYSVLSIKERLEWEEMVEEAVEGQKDSKGEYTVKSGGGGDR